MSGGMFTVVWDIFIPYSIPSYVSFKAMNVILMRAVVNAMPIKLPIKPRKGTPREFFKT